MKSMKINKNAFTMIEVLVAMLVLAIGLLGMAGMTVIVLRSNTLSQQISEATNVASNLMDRIKILPLSSLPNCVQPTVFSSASLPVNCNSILTSGLSGSTDFYPPTSATNCGIGGFEDETSFQQVGSDHVATNTIDLLPYDVCDFGSGSPSLAKGSYLRYFRTFQPTGGSSTDRSISVVVLWQDRFSKWRHIRLSTTKSQ